MKAVNVTSAIVAGMLGTVVMTTLMYLAPLMGLPKMDLLYALGSVFPLPLSPYVMGGIVHLAIGVALALSYALLADRWLPGPRWARGALYSILPWAVALVGLGPMLMTAQTLLNPSPVAVHAANPCQPTRALSNPCAISNPCGAVSRSAAIANPCAPANPCAAPSSGNRWMGPLLSFVAHLVYGGVVGLAYRPRRTCCAGCPSEFCAA